MTPIRKRKAQLTKRMLEDLRAKNKESTTEPLIAETPEPAISDDASKAIVDSIDNLNKTLNKNVKLLDTNNLKSSEELNDNILKVTKEIDATDVKLPEETPEPEKLKEPTEEWKPVSTPANNQPLGTNQEPGFWKSFSTSFGLEMIGQGDLTKEMLEPKDKESSDSLAAQEEQMTEQNILIEKGTDAQEAQVTKLEDNSKILTSIDKNILELKDLVKANGMGGGGGGGGPGVLDTIKGATNAVNAAKGARTVAKGAGTAAKGAGAAAKGAGAAAKGAGAAAKGASALGKAANIAGKGLAVLAAGEAVYSGISDLADGKKVESVGDIVPEGWDMLNPASWAMRAGMYGGEKINKSVEEATGGQSIGSKIYDAVDTVAGWFGGSDKDKQAAATAKAEIELGQKRLAEGRTISKGLAEKLKKAGIEVRDDQITPSTKGPAQKSISEQMKSAVPVGPDQAVKDISAGNSARKINLEARRAMKGAVSADTARTLSDQETIMTEAGKRYGALVGDKNADPKKVAEAKKAYEKEQAAYNSMKDFNDENEEFKGPAQQAVQSQIPEVGNINVSFSEATFAQNDPENFQKYQDFKNETAKQLLKQALERGDVSRGQIEEFAIKAKIIAIKKFKKEARAAGALTDKQDKQQGKPIGIMEDGTTIRSNTVNMEQAKKGTVNLVNQMNSSLAGTPTPAKDAVAQQAIPISAAATTEKTSGTLQGFVPDKEEWKKRTQEKLAAYPESMRNDPITKREARDAALMEMKREAVKKQSSAPATPAKDAVAQQAVPINEAPTVTKTPRVAELEKTLADTKAAGPKGDSTRAKQAHEDKIKMIEKEIEKEKSSSGVPTTATESVSGTLQGYVPDREEWKKRTAEQLKNNPSLTRQEARENALAEMKRESLRESVVKPTPPVNAVSQPYVSPEVAELADGMKQKPAPIIIPSPPPSVDAPRSPTSPPFNNSIRNQEVSAKSYIQRRYNPGMAT